MTDVYLPKPERSPETPLKDATIQHLYAELCHRATSSESTGVFLVMSTPDINVMSIFGHEDYVILLLGQAVAKLQEMSRG